MLITIQCTLYISKQLIERVCGKAKARQALGQDKSQNLLWDV